MVLIFYFLTLRFLPTQSVVIWLDYIYIYIVKFSTKFWFYNNGITIIAEEFDIIDFKGGLYAVATGIDQQTDRGLMNAEVDKFLSENGFEREASRPELGNIITSPLAQEIMGYEQMDYYTPIKGRV